MPMAVAKDDLTSVVEASTLLDALFVQSPVPYLLVREAGQPLIANAAYRALFGADPSPEYNARGDAALSPYLDHALSGEAAETPLFWREGLALRCKLTALASSAGRLVAIAFQDVSAEERLAETLESAEVGTWEWDIRKNRVHWSRNIESIFGLAPGSFSGTYEAWLALVHPEDRDRAQATVVAAVEACSSYETEFRFVRPDGSIGWQHARGHIVQDESGRAQFLRGIVLDVTARRVAEDARKSLAAALQHNEARYRAFVSLSSEGIWRIELKQPVPIHLPADEQIEAFYACGYLAECNDAMARMYGYERAEELHGARLGDLLVRDDPRNHAYLSAFISSGYRLGGAESQELDRFGKRRVFENSLVGVIEDGALRSAWGTQRDVTSQVAAREQAEEASRSKDEFFAVLGHELRNPLSPILTALELMKLRDPHAFPKERAIIERQVKHVVRLVDDLLDVSRMTRGVISLDRRPLDLADAIAAGIELASPLLEHRAHHVSVNVAPGLIVDGDPTRLGQVFANLLTNAAKYTPSGGRITVTGAAEGGEARITVRDTGIGIRPDILPRVFEMFVQERQTIDRADGGLGLGLAIVRSLVTLHGGRVEAHSEGSGLGSELVVHLPLIDHAPARAATGETPRTAPAAGAVRVLIVDDNRDAADLLADALATWGHVVQVANDAADALKMLEHWRPEVALLDIGLPVMDGYELARRIRANAALQGMRLLAVTGYGQAEDREAALRAGFDEHLVKPVDLASLRAALTRLLAAK
ncbi:MAG TPA: ATP-binding protein [Polyangiales bacterium]|nr:ATP-binding protein [Polyangiales bacterium]